MCGIYETRPEFCKVDPKKYKTMFGVEQEDLNVRTSRECMDISSLLLRFQF
jgi:hypothetical protein